MKGIGFSLIIPAAGSGTRMQSDIPKPYLKLGEKLILQHTLECFQSLKDLREVIVATSPDFISETEKILSELFPEIPVIVVRGGNERRDSIKNALGQVSDTSELIAVHDAVRPFVDGATIKSCLQKAIEVGGAIVAVPVKDTIKKVTEDLIIAKTPDRSRLWQAQTPQVFRRKLLIEAYQNNLSENSTVTDDASLIELAGGKVAVVEGSRENFKLTYPLDMAVAEMLVKRRS